MRIIAGSAKGTRLVAPKGLEVRPTLDRVREALFSILTPRLDGARFLDLFAGTGANGIEALSRGAAACAFVDQDRRAIAVIERNLEAAHLADQGQVRRLTLPQGVLTLAREGHPYDIVFADPPYEFPEYASLLEMLHSADLVALGGLVVVEHASRISLDDKSNQFRCVRRATYGDTALSFFA